MKKLLFIILIGCCALTANSQDIKVRKLKQLDVKENAFFPSFGNTKNEILYTGLNYTGLSLYNIRSKKDIQISESRNAGSQRIIQDDKIIFKQNSIIKGKKTTEYHSFDISESTLTKTNAPSLTGNQEIKIFAKTHGKEILLINPDSDSVSISPLGDHYYLWASVSPNGEKVLFTAAGKGTYICDLDGNILQDLKYLNAPSWINNEWVTGMNDLDDGEVIISSEIMAIHLEKNKKIILTDKEKHIAMYPKFSNTGDRFAFSTPDGKIYTAKVKIKK